MNDWLNKPWVIRVISLILALLIFTIITFDNRDTSGDALRLDLFSSSQETQIVDDVPINVNMSDDYVVSGVPDTATVTLKGTVSVVQSTAAQRNFDLIVDLEGLEPGTHTVPIEYEGISDRINAEVDPAEIQVTIEEKATTDFTVTPDYTNEDLLEPGYELQDATIDPSTVSITSSKSVIDSIAVVKAVVDVEGIQESVTINDVHVRVYDSEGNELSAKVDPETVDVTVNVDNPNKSVPISVETTGEPQEGIQIVSLTPETEEVQVYASKTNLQDITEITTEAIDVSEITEDTSVEIELNPPDNVRLLKPKTINVQVDVNKEVEQTFKGVDIEVDNLGEGYTASFVEPENSTMDITVTGYESVLADVEASDFTLTVDASNLTPGEHQIPIEVSAPDELDVSLASENATINVE
ncbi:cdaA regulatory protein CdaR [Paraliobacillus ryukyuensis]|uniref:YbbR domain-containing protein n=1 Tax=Paraliobacillus ryukyuensis TaxID=200904 RepID=A0A366DZJ3_9BACI|nr:CdaR family protein [Paraliobacillus ryukyuensis]RBO95285.1 YbbR domain-containing protein [Paraliobacillus ryukyuensis]